MNSSGSSGLSFLCNIFPSLYKRGNIPSTIELPCTRLKNSLKTCSPLVKSFFRQERDVLRSECRGTFAKEAGPPARYEGRQRSYGCTQHQHEPGKRKEKGVGMVLPEKSVKPLVLAHYGLSANASGTCPFTVPHLGRREKSDLPCSPMNPIAPIHIVEKERKLDIHRTHALNHLTANQKTGTHWLVHPSVGAVVEVPHTPAGEPGVMTVKP